jgi:DNA-binding transcriptional regulator of glucitol operon
MAVTMRESRVPAEARWKLLLRPRWLAWHAFVIVATAGMLLLGDWQLHRAESGNSLSWAYTFEWPLFSAFTVYFWIKSLRDEVRGTGAAASVESGSLATAGPAAAMTTEAASPDQTSRVAGSSPDPSDTAASWDATTWGATKSEAGRAGNRGPVDIARATPADGEAYLARLMAEVQGPARRRGRP